MPLEFRSPTTLTPYANNPRRNDKAVDTVAKSITEFGFQSPIIVDRDGVIIAGHTRLKAALKLGLETVPVLTADLPPDKAAALRLVDNRSGELATWDIGLLEAEVAALADLDLDAYGFDALLAEADELADATDAATDNATGGAEDDELPPPEPLGEPVTRLGDLWLIGEHRLLCGDSRDAGDVAKLMGGKLVTVAFTSPPYASRRVYDSSTAFKPIKHDDYVEWFASVAANVAEHLAADGSWFVNIKADAVDGERSLYVMDLTQAHVRLWGWRFVDEFCWYNVKNGVPGAWHGRFKNAFEPIYHYTRGDTPIRFNPLANGTPEIGEALPPDKLQAKQRARNNRPALLKNSLPPGSVPAAGGIARPSNVIKLASANAVPGHPAQYPPALPAWFIRAFSDAGDVVYDPFLGSGSTTVAAHREGRLGYGMEISPYYCDVALARLQQLTGKMPVLESSGVAHDFLEVSELD